MEQAAQAFYSETHQGGEDMDVEDEFEAQFTKLHTDSCLEFYIVNSGDKVCVDQINGWIDIHTLPEKELLVFYIFRVAVKTVLTV
jgi:hypothetical protein